MWVRGRTSAHGAMGCRIDPSWRVHCAISHSSPKRVAHVVAAAGFLSEWHFTISPTHITVNKMC